MSMLGVQIKELREAARNIQGKLGRCLYRRKDVDEMQQVSGMLFEAANTIESLRYRLQAVSETCRIEWRDDSHDTDAGYEYDGAYFCTRCMADLPQPLQECWDDYQALVADYGNVPPWDKKPFRCCPNCGREVVDA